MLEGFAYCQMIYDDQRRPVNWVFLAVNKAFGTLTGLGDVAGRRGSEVMPGIHQANPELLETYGRVAAGGGAEAFESFVVPLGRWLSISVFSPAPDHFVAVFEDVTQRRQNEERLAAYQQQLRLLGSKLASAEENERRRIAADLHDNVVQSLAAASLRLQTVGAGDLAPAAAASFSEALRLLHQAVQDTRSLMFELCPPPLYELGLEAALEWLVEKVGKSTAWRDPGRRAGAGPTGRRGPGHPVPGGPRVAAEHRQARPAGKAAVSFRRQGDGVRIEVRDDGRGFSPQGATAGRGLGGFGLFEVRERLDYIGGSLQIESPAEGGPRRCCWRPCRRPKKE